MSFMDDLAIETSVTLTENGGRKSLTANQV